ncbi:hemolysin family protein [Corynebacterium guangdongense]|uniref:CBS domain containing-hemolysin-like protein n=1 Tax=Corynebacterium guangdongense TaxID=1783348 RepID=A0ABU1ZYG6_9CORY|nr:hemolysin family protein [Corynebacterium guangdongense]MDR7329970.1 CBS domain containing-hemolysin-like protein [Corynebacterium guangdongense]WJZ18528.1 Magnesium and cobalt efflux protein CorC [Corynebacterium guangdongense]
MEIALPAVVAVVALLFSGLIGTVEAAVTSISRARVEDMVKDEVSGAPALLRVLDRRADHINLLVLLKTLLDATAAVFAALAAQKLIAADAWAITAAIVAVALLSFAVVGVFSRTVGRQNPYSVSLNSARVLSVLRTLLGPIATLLIRVGNVIAPGHGFREGPYATEVELREMVDIAQERGIVEVEERRMIQNIFDLATTTARSVMVPRPEMIWIEADKNAGQATNLLIRSGHSRMPVIGENVDDVLGVVFLKDLVARTYHRTDGGGGVRVGEVLRPATFVPDTKNLDELLHEMQRDNSHMAMLVDEYGGIAGLVTMEDILEEIVGEITDEYDDKEVAPVEKLAGRSYRVVSRLSLEDLSERIEEDLDLEVEYSDEVRDQVDTVAGLLAYELGRVPLPGSSVEVAGLRLTAEGGRDRRGRMKVRSVVVDVLADSAAADDADRVQAAGDRGGGDRGGGEE